MNNFYGNKNNSKNQRKSALICVPFHTDYEYDANGNRTKLIDADRKTTTFEYNLDNRLTKKIYPDTRFIEYTYDLAGLLTRTTNSRNISINYPTYDPNHNLLTIDYSDTTPDVTFTYDDYNRLQTRTDGIGLYQYGYDDNNRLTSIDSPWANDTITYQYNELSQFTDLIPQGGQSISYTYEPIGRLTNIQSGTNIYTYGYTGVNPLIQTLTRPNGSITEYLYNDPLKRLTDMINKDSSDQVINSNAFTFNNLDLIGSENIANATLITSFTEGLITYDYNDLNQLLSSANPDKLYTYDDDGNMTQGYTPDGYVLTMTYDAANRLTTAEYTDSSSVLHRTEYFYSGDNFLAEVRKYEDGVIVTDTRFIRAGFLPLQERDENNVVTREYTWGLNYGGGIGGLLNLNQGGLDYSYLYDGKGNITAVIDNSQSVVASYRYDTFGVLMTKAGTIEQPFQFSTKRYDEETGLSYYGFRYYNPSTGRWITRDPIGEAGEINLYGFVGNSPMNFYDPYGLWAPPVSYKGYFGYLLTSTGLVIALIPGGQVAGACLALGGLDLIYQDSKEFVKENFESAEEALKPIQDSMDELQNELNQSPRSGGK